MQLARARIRTLDPARPLATGLAVEGERIASLDPAGPGAIDLGGRCVVPGFSDAHAHFATWAIGRERVRLDGAGSLAEAVARVAAADVDAVDGTWVRGYGWRDAGWEAEPTAEALDAAVGDRPVALLSKDYHSLWLSSAALARAGRGLDELGEVVERDADGRPTGILREQAAWDFLARWQAPDPAEIERAIVTGLPVAAARGVTAIHDKDGGQGVLPVWGALEARGALTLRVWQSLPHDQAETLAERPAGTDRLRVGYLKAFVDGTLGSTTALMLDGTGVEITPPDALEAAIRRGAAIGLALGVHAIGDRANRQALDAFHATRDAWAPLGLRPRIEHAQLLAAPEVARFAQIGVTASVQFSHAPSDRDLADAAWGERAELAYAWRALRDAGAVLANGSDAPVEELDPLAGLRAAVRRTIDERPAWHPEQALTMEEALEATCVAPAWLAHDEHRRGRLAPGWDADLVVLSRDPVDCPPDELDSIEVEATMVAGTWTYVSPSSPIAASR